MLLVCVVNKAKALNFIVDSKGFGVSVLAEHQRSVSKHFAGKPEFDEAIFCQQQKVEILIMVGEPLNEPVVRGGPFVMNSKAGIQKAFTDYQSGKFGQV